MAVPVHTNTQAFAVLRKFKICGATTQKKNLFLNLSQLAQDVEWHYLNYTLQQ